MVIRGKTLAALTFVVCAGVAQAQQAKSYPGDMADRVQACTPCHGAEGKGTNDPYFPRLAGKPAGYLFNQLEAFKSGRRKYPPMNYLLAFLTDDYLKQFAEYFADQRPPLPETHVSDASQSVLDHGHVLVTQGDLDRAIPACVSCHGASLTGQSPGIPGLLGLRPSYVSAQLGGWRYGTRTAIAPDCMQLVAGRLTEDDVRAVAAYLASQPLPEDPTPAPPGSFPPPFACGSQPDRGSKP